MPSNYGLRLVIRSQPISWVLAYILITVGLLFFAVGFLRLDQTSLLYLYLGEIFVLLTLLTKCECNADGLADQDDA